MREYYAFRTHDRIGEGHIILLGGRLFLQFVVDSWCSMERGRLLWVQTHYLIIRIDLYNNIIDDFRHGDVDATDVGKHVILPSSSLVGTNTCNRTFKIHWSSARNMAIQIYSSLLHVIQNGMKYKRLFGL